MDAPLDGSPGSPFSAALREMVVERWVWVPFEVDKKFDGLRIDQFLSRRLAGYSRNKVRKILDESRVLKGGFPAKPNTRVRPGDKITIAYLRRPEVPPPADRTIPILFEDGHLLAVDKPAGVLSHPTDKIVMNTVPALLRRDRPDLARLHLLHRLDRETSGVIVLAKDIVAARRWTTAMEKHRIQKEYFALVRGVPQPAEGVIDWPIGRQAGDIKVRQWVNVPDAASARTRYEVVSSFQSVFSVVRAFPQTGRLHQIRVHFAAKGHPLLGDPLYTGEGEIYRKMICGAVTEEDRASLGFPRTALHAQAIVFPHSVTGAPLRIEAPLPEDLKRAIVFVLKPVYTLVSH